MCVLLCDLNVLQTAQLQSQLLKKDADIAAMTDKLEAAIAAAADAAEQSQTTAAAAALARGAAGLNEETKKALAVAQQQVRLLRRPFAHIRSLSLL